MNHEVTYDFVRFSRGATQLKTNHFTNHSSIYLLSDCEMNMELPYEYSRENYDVFIIAKKFSNKCQIIYKAFPKDTIGNLLVVDKNYDLVDKKFWLCDDVIPVYQNQSWTFIP
jgi:hypothetical protein